METIFIEKLEVFAYHGVHQEEQILGQKFVISGEFYLDFFDAYESDDIKRSVNYSTLAKEIERFVRTSRFSLIETLAQQLSEYLFDMHTQLFRIVLKIEKPWAPIKIPLRSVGIKIERSRHTIYLCIHSSSNEYKGFFSTIIENLKNNKCINIVNLSEIYHSESEGIYSMCIKACTTLEILQIKKLLSASFDNTVLVLFDNVYNPEYYQIPLPGMQNNKYLLGALVQIAPHYIHPGFHKSITQLFSEL